MQASLSETSSTAEHYEDMGMALLLILSCTKYIINGNYDLKKLFCTCATVKRWITIVMSGSGITRRTNVFSRVAWA